MSSSKRAAEGGGGGGGKAAKQAPAQGAQFFRGVTMLAAPSLGGLMLRKMPQLVAGAGGVMATSMKLCGATPPTHVVVATGSSYESGDAERKALGAPDAARLVAMQWVRGAPLRCAADVAEACKGAAL